MIHYSFQTPRETQYSNSIILKIIYRKNPIYGNAFQKVMIYLVSY